MLSEVAMIDFDGPFKKCDTCGAVIGRTLVKRKFCPKCSDGGKRYKT
tara:strand:- start:742 stop:882 length:141 start_codon:yes stop_codon:yes gene_type:complete